MLSETQRMDIANLVTLLEDMAIEKATLPVAVLQQLAKQCVAEQRWERGPLLPNLREVITTGEQIQITAPIIICSSVCRIVHSIITMGHLRPTW